MHVLEPTAFQLSRQTCRSAKAAPLITWFCDSVQQLILCVKLTLPQGACPDICEASVRVLGDEINMWLADCVKQIALPNLSGPHSISWRPEQNKCQNFPWPSRLGSVAEFQAMNQEIPSRGYPIKDSSLMLLSPSVSLSVSLSLKHNGY